MENTQTESREQVKVKQVNLASLINPNEIQRNSDLEKKLIYMAVLFEAVGSPDRFLEKIEKVGRNVGKILMDHLNAMKYVKDMKNRIYVLPFDYPRIHPLFYELITNGEKILFTSFDTIEYHVFNPGHACNFIDINRIPMSEFNPNILMKDEIGEKIFVSKEFLQLKEKLQNLRVKYNPNRANRYKKTIVDSILPVFSRVASLGAIYNVTRIDALSETEKTIMDQKDVDPRIERSIAFDPITQRSEDWANSFIKSNLRIKNELRDLTDGKDRSKNLEGFTDALKIGFLLHDNFVNGGLVEFRDDRVANGMNLNSKENSKRNK